MNEITTLLFDLGGVVLSNGWDTDGRKAGAEHFSIDFEEMEKKHDRIFFDFEKGKISLSDYVDEVVFFKERDFTKEDFIRFMKERSRPQKSSIEILEKLADSGKYFLATINNESYELNLLRINQNKLYKYFKVFFSSAFLGTRKPEPLIFNVALNVLHKDPSECLFIDDKKENVEEAMKHGINTIHLNDITKLKDKLIENRILI